MFYRMQVNICDFLIHNIVIFFYKGHKQNFMFLCTSRIFKTTSCPDEVGVLVVECGLGPNMDSIG